jgi:hypothetical protein
MELKRYIIIPAGATLFEDPDGSVCSFSDVSAFLSQHDQEVADEAKREVIEKIYKVWNDSEWLDTCEKETGEILRELYKQSGGDPALLGKEEEEKKNE